jgi:two-component system chemotaxis sensor kinase CheA
MNDFLKQFLIESREFAEQASEGLLTLERAPDDAELLDAVFRAFHTLKGGAGIVEFAAMERAVHAAENVLSDVRSGRQALTAARVGDCLGCLDQVIQWLDTIERTGNLPTNSEAAADAIVRRLDAVAAGALVAVAVSDLPTDAWVTDLMRRHQLLGTPPSTALRFVPDSDCFYQGEDPVARITSIPQLLAMDLEPSSAAPPLNLLDVYQCNLVLTALTAASVSELNLHMKGCAGECEIVPIKPAPPSNGNSLLSAHAREVLAEQIESLRDLDSRNFIGRVCAAGLTAANVLRFCGRSDQAELFAAVTEQCLLEQASQPLQEAIARVLTGSGMVESDSPASSRHAEPANRTLRIDAERIDALVRLTGELTVAKNAFGHLVKLAQTQGNSLAGSLKERHGTLEHLIRELQTAVLGMRVLPLRSVLQRFSRIVREMASRQGKTLQLQIDGEETEADKAIVEMLFEPLLHIVRNAVDHGVEDPQQRANRGKPATATVRIRAARQGEHVVIEVSDDGGGIDIERVRQVAVQRRVVTEERLGTMTESEIVALIFAPGFSTATSLTALSGRGVGMDAVRTAVERVGGQVSADSRPGLGTTIRLLLPFSVMMTRVLTVEVGAQIFGIPLDAIVETVRVPQDALVGVGAAHAIVVRDRTVPVVELAQALGVAHSNQKAALATIVIAASQGQWAGIKVDQVGEQMEVILQPLDGLLAGTPGIAGTTMLGDGRVLLVLDIGAMLQ